MKKIRYIGPEDQVEVPAAGVTVQKNHQVEIEDDDLAKSLLEQTDNWEKVTAKKESNDG